MSTKTTHVMIDIETLGLDIATCPVLQIGMVSFDSDGISSHQSLWIRPEGSIEASTLAWHINKNSGYLARWANARQHIGYADIPFSMSLLINTDTIVWCKSPDFDIAILKRIFRGLGLDVPWSYKNVRDYRTISETFGWLAEYIPEHPSHDALNDALNQAGHLIDIDAALKETSNLPLLEEYK